MINTDSIIIRIKERGNKMKMSRAGDINNKMDNGRRVREIRLIGIKNNKLLKIEQININKLGKKINKNTKALILHSQKAQVDKISVRDNMNNIKKKNKHIAIIDKKKIIPDKGNMNQVTLKIKIIKVIINLLIQIENNPTIIPNLLNLKIHMNKNMTTKRHMNNIKKRMFG